MDHAASVSEWHSIRPWTPRLSLIVREINSVSATFVLSSSLTGLHSDLEPSLGSLQLTPDFVREEGDSDSDSSEGEGHAIVSEALAKGLSVNVNNAPWPKVYIRIDEKADEAVIIIYGLMPGRQYDIDLGLVQNGQSDNIRSKVVTEGIHNETYEELENEGISTDGALLPDSLALSPASNHPQTHSLSTTPPSSTPLSTVSSNTLTVEEHLQQLQHTLSAITAERDSLVTSLKSARRDAQKADAALRAEIDTLKRASEKHVASEHRARQKVLALQEAVKRAQTTTKEMEVMFKEAQASLPALNKHKSEREVAYAKIKEEVDRVKKDREDEVERNRRRLDSMKGDLTGLGHKLERLNGKREKLETSVIPDLEEQLREIQREIDRAESDSQDFTAPLDHPEPGTEENDHSGVRSGIDPSPDQVLQPTQYTTMQRKRHQNQHSLGAIGRPSPIQRPFHSHPSLWSPNRQIQITTPHRNSFQPQPPIHTHTQAHRHLPSNSTTLSSESSSNPPSSAQSSGSTLSSRAAPFEPSRNVAQALRASGSTATSSLDLGYGQWSNSRGDSHSANWPNLVNSSVRPRRESNASGQ